MNSLRSSIILLLLLAWCGTLRGQSETTHQQQDAPPAADTMEVRYDYTPIYNSPSYTANILGDKQKGDMVAVVGKVGKFVQVLMPFGTGFIARVNLRNISGQSDNPQHDSAAARESAPPPTYLLQPPNKETPQPTAAEHRCKGITKSGKQCSRKAEAGGEYCWQHRPNNRP
ncbi:MAG: hypothetical protein DYG96_06895 [Chlorobi bacterium CHB2]|nr:hypothetical protein [Chlorobi bacterium CHB2]